MPPRFVVYVGAGADLARIPDEYQSERRARVAAFAALSSPGVAWACIARVDQIAPHVTRETTITQIARFAH